MVRLLVLALLASSLAVSTVGASPRQGADDPLLVSGSMERLPGAPQHAGTYHVAAGTWTRTGGVAAASFGPDVIYSNTAQSGYFSSVGSVGGFAPGSIVVDEGLIPTSNNADHPGANRDTYSVNCVSIGYCDLGSPGSSGWELRFYDSYDPCNSVGEPPVTHGFVVTGLPAGGCWTVDLDLAGGEEFCLAGDGGDGYDGDVDNDSFGWSFQYAGSDGSAPAGFQLTGDPLATDPNWAPGMTPSYAGNTYFGLPSLCQPAPGVEAATGNATGDFYFLINQPLQLSNCFFFGGYRNFNGCGGPSARPYASWYMEIAADPGGCDQDPTGQSYCNSNPNSTGVESQLSLRGSTSVLEDNFRLDASALPTDSFGYFITSLTAGFTMNPAGSAGNICVSGAIGRLRGPGQIKNSGASGTMVLDTTLGEWSTTAIPLPNGAYPASAGLTTYFQLWHRDSSPSGGTSNFSNGMVVTWTP